MADVEMYEVVNSILEKVSALEIQGYIIIGLMLILLVFTRWKK